jgi:hypothetical protein
MTSENRRLKMVYLAGLHLLFSAKFFYDAYFTSDLMMAVVLGLQVVEEPTGRPFQVV